MKRSLQRNKRPESDSCEEDTSTSTSSDSDQGGATPRKRLRADENLVHGPETSYDAKYIYQDPLDEGRVDPSEISENFDKAVGTIERRERIEIR
ncbi:hypothetical protein N7478_010075 [Penicillium angulare]|uniref:uncharacterized protein n=1 Tax=Penicillium angulare TaxID=116970 RepID=UPI00253F9A35|nr:uncharacterized protein N7478_010075 [Penicillium angulare]KAJ5267267.1 hypothetical protein N7478_010075 [Penicillium angulare]